MKHNLDLGKARVGGLLSRMALPAVISITVNGLYYLVDAAFVGWGAGSRALAGLAVIFPVQLLTIGSMIGMGAASIISHKLGAGESAESGRAAEKLRHAAPVSPAGYLPDPLHR